MRPGALAEVAAILLTLALPLLCGLPLAWLLRGRGPLDREGWLLAPYLGLGALVLVLQNLVYSDVPVARAAPFVWLAVAGLCALAVFPYYPYILTAYADPEFGAQFWTALAAAAVGLLAGWLRDDAAALAQMLLAAAGLAVTARAVWGLWPAAAEVGLPERPGEPHGADPGAKRPAAQSG